ncbi:MAG: FAD-dependent oxidoreductase [Verrucomicrobiota bacterium]
MTPTAVAAVSSSSGAAAPILILGQGLAGTLLAWQLHWLGRRVMLLDREDAVTSSRIAAGIVTPITGKRVALSHEVDIFLPEATACYQRAAAALGAAHFHPLPQVRLFQNDTERASFADKRTRPEFVRHLSGPQPEPLADATLIQGPLDGFEMRDSGWLDTRAWLAASAAFFAARGEYRQASVQPADISLTAGGVSVAGLHGSALVFCEGHAGAANPWFPWLKWKSAKGEILTLSIPGLRQEHRILNRGGWLLPVDGAAGGGTFRSGATYTWDDLSTTPTPEARTVLEQRLQSLLRVPWEVTAHHAAVRPILHQSLAKMGRHPSHPALVFFNGLGSKGVLHGPRYTRLLAENLVHNAPIPSHLDVAGNH